ncbi:MAG: endonuclease/exonuclease/phosphatase family protein [Akkermansiaceae bacterium]|nr:endonuclease/exonuclease/phosphatase family protein [Akkermansiaceae bacterium]
MQKESFMPRLCRHLLSLLKVGVRLAAVASLLAFGARWHWLMDTLANFRVQYALYLVVATLLLLLWRNFRWSSIAGVAAALNLWIVFPYCMAPPDSASGGKEMSESFRLMNFNVLSSNRCCNEVEAYLREIDADFVFMLETSPDWEPTLKKMRDIYPHQKNEIQSGNFGIALLSKTPFKEVKISEYTATIPSIDAVVLVGEERVRLIGTHPYPPINAKVSGLRNSHMQRLAESIAHNSVATKTIVAGDFNMTPWSPHFRNFLLSAQLEDSAKGRDLQPTWYALPTFFFGIPIDHICYSRGLRVDTRRVGPDLGSDHRAVWVDFWIGD